MGGESQGRENVRKAGRTRRGAIVAILMVVAVCAGGLALAREAAGTGLAPIALWIVTVVAVLAAFPILFFRRRNE
jgi:hypothetical protein